MSTKKKGGKEVKSPLVSIVTPYYTISIIRIYSLKKCKISFKIALSIKKEFLLNLIPVEKNVL